MAVTFGTDILGPRCESYWLRRSPKFTSGSHKQAEISVLFFWSIRLITMIMVPRGWILTSKLHFSLPIEISQIYLMVFIKFVSKFMVPKLFYQLLYVTFSLAPPQGWIWGFQLNVSITIALSQIFMSIFSIFFSSSSVIRSTFWNEQTNGSQ